MHLTPIFLFFHENIWMTAMFMIIDKLKKL